MKILFIYDRQIIPNYGGVERVTWLISNELKTRGYDIAFLSVGPEEWNETRVDYGIPQYYINSSDIDFEDKFKQFLKDQHIDISIVQGMHNSVMPVLPLLPKEIIKLQFHHLQPYSFASNVRYIHHLMPWNELDLKSKVVKAMGLAIPSLYVKLKMRKALAVWKHVSSFSDRIVMLSDRFIDRVIKYNPGLDKLKLTSLSNPNTFQIDLYENSNEKENIVLFVGRLSNPQKNVTGFIDIWEKFHKLHPDWKALILGDGEHKSFIMRYAEKKGVKGLTFTGNIKNVADFYKKARLLCMTSTYEGWGMVLPEAMAYGCVPVAYESFESISDIVDSGENGLLVSPFKNDEMVDSLSKLATDEELRLKMAENGKMKIKKFDVKAVADRWEDLFRDISVN